MSWIIASILLIIGSSVMYLSIRNIDKSYIPIEIKNLAIFFTPIIPLFMYNHLNNIENTIGFKYLIILFLSAIFLAWLANISSLISIKISPNPGYPLILSKSYVIYTLIFSYLFLGSELSIIKLIIIIFIILFSILIIYNKNKTITVKNKKWLLYSLYSFLSWGNLALILTYLTQRGIPSTTINIYLSLFVSIFILIEILIKKVKYKPRNKIELTNLLIIGLAFTLFQQSMVYGYTVAPNPGYINAVNTASIGVITILS